MFLTDIHAQCAGGHLLLGADLVKDSAEIVAAYDDALGVTAAFNLNVLNVVNRLAGTDFTPSDWRHVALFNAAESRIEMHLEARRPVRVGWPGGERRLCRRCAHSHGELLQDHPDRTCKPAARGRLRQRRSLHGPG